MFSIRVSATFNATHAVMINGTDEAPHSHEWEVFVVLEGNSLNKDGVLIDFIDVERFLAEILEPLTDSNLNTIETLGGENPSAERVALYVGDAMQAKMQGTVRVQSVTITEAPNCQATYTL